MYMNMVIKFLKTGLSSHKLCFGAQNFAECVNRSENVRNRKYGLFAIDIDGYIFF